MTANGYIRVRVESDLEEAAELNGEEGLAELNPSGYPNVVVFLDCLGNDLPCYFGAHELVLLPS